MTGFKPGQFVESIEVLTEPERRRRRSVPTSYSQARLPDWQDGRRARRTGDSGLLAEIHEMVADLPTYGYWRVWALLRSSHELIGAPRVNAKHVYRVMRDHQLLLRRPGRRSDTRRHDGRIAVDRSNARWCSDGFEFRCDDGARCA